jgi:hypothetical protein
MKLTRKSKAPCLLSYVWGRHTTNTNNIMKNRLWGGHKMEREGKRRKLRR